MILLSLSKRRVRKGERVSKKLADEVFSTLRPVERKGIDKREFLIGMNTECEHFDITRGNLRKTAKITLTHLREISDYYTRLRRMKKEGKQELKERKYRRKHPQTFTFVDVDETDGGGFI